MLLRLSSLLFSTILLSLLNRPAQAAVRLPRLVGSHMVLQRNVPLPLWGWAEPGEMVRVAFRAARAQTTADPNGRWQVTLPAQVAGGPFELTVQASDTLRLTDVLVGDVWLASGQSNMEWPLRNAANGPAETAAARFPNLRLFAVPNRAELRPQTELAGGEWQPCTPESAAEFSAVAYYFGRDLLQRYNVPVGLIAADWGGTVAEAWVSAEALQQLPDFRASVAALQTQNNSFAEQEAAYLARLNAWQQSPAGQDQGLQPGQPTWAEPTFSTADWPTMLLPGYWENLVPTLRDFDGIIWLRRNLTLPTLAAGQPLTLTLAKVDDEDSTFFNGVAIGGTRGYDKLRRYTVPAALVRPGRNVLAVRVTDHGGGGGLWGQPTDLSAVVNDLSVPLAGGWQYRLAQDSTSRPANPLAGGANNAPTALFNGMIAPLLPFALKGIIWYQGESNADRAAQYRTLFPALIQDWRQRWQQPALPFLFVQLAAYQPDPASPATSTWAELREAQRYVSRTVPRTAMAVALDLGDVNDIHPLNKRDVGRRLALAARRLAYSETTLVASGPTVAGVTPERGSLTVRFGNVGGGLVLRPAAAAGTGRSSFAIAGPDRRFVWAKAEVQGSTVVLQAAGVPNPVAVRYAWGNNRPATLFNTQGLPAPPFRAGE